MTSVAEIQNVFLTNGSDTLFHRSDSLIPCPCRTPEGYRDMEWHLRNPQAPMCDASGMLPDPSSTVDLVVKAFVQPVTSARGAKLPAETLPQLFGSEIQADDHIGIFPESWQGVTLNFWDWGRGGEDYIEYNGRQFLVVNGNLIPDPYGDPRGHWEVGLRLITDSQVAISQGYYGVDAYGDFAYGGDASV